MKSLKIVNVFLPILLLLIMSNSLLAQTKITGENVGYVKEKYRTTVIHIWQQTGKKVWTRTQQGSNSTVKYIEYARDAWSVYLQNSQGKMQIDLYKKKVINKKTNATGVIIASGPSKFSSSTSQSGSAVIKAKGNDVSYAKVSRNGKAVGSFKQVGTKLWKEYKNGKAWATFTETRRGPWGVYLYDKSRKINVHIDLHTKKVKINGSNYFDVTYADARKVAGGNTTTTTASNTNIKAKGRTVTYIKFNGKGKPVGSLKQIGAKKWNEYKNGKVFATFAEYNRDENSVYMKDAGRNLKLQIDLYTKKVKINGQNYFDITYADARKVSKSPTPTPVTTNTNNQAQDVILNLSIQVEKVDDGDSDEEIFGNLWVNVGGKKVTLFNKSEDDHVHLKQWKSHKTKSKKFTITNQSISFGGWLKEEDTGGDDNLGSTSKRLSSAEVRSHLNSKKGSPHIVFRHDATVVVVYLQIRKPSFSTRQAYSISNIPGLISGDDLYHYTDATFKGMKDAFYDKTDKGSTYDYVTFVKATRNNHIQGAAVTDRGRIILSHDVHIGEGYLLYSEPFTKCEKYSNFSWFRFDIGSHPSAMQSCGDYVATTVSKQGIYFFKSREDGMYPMKNLTISGNVNSAGIVYHKKERRYYVLHTNTSHYSANATLKLYKSSSSNLNDASCKFELVSTTTGPASSMGTQLLYQEDGTLFTLCMYTNKSGGNAAPITDYIVLSKYSSDKKTCTKVKSVSNYRGTALMTSACFRWAGTCRIMNNKLYVIGVDRSFSDPYVLKYYKTKK